MKLIPLCAETAGLRCSTFVVIALALALGGCGDAAEDEERVLASGEALVGPDGGVVASDDGLFRVEIPVGALQGEVLITIEPRMESAPGGAGNIYEVGPGGTQLSIPARVIWEFGNLERERELRIGSLQPNGDWEAAGAPVTDPQAGIASGSIPQLSQVGLLRAGCEENSDCEESLLCVSRTCRRTSCENDEDCDAGQKCEAGLCVRPSSCETNLDCKRTHACIEGDCIFRGECEGDLSCDDGEVCEDGGCKGFVECFDEAQCAEGEACLAGQCLVPDACMSDDDCLSSAKQCLGGFCRRPDLYCAVDEDCAAGYLCVESECALRTSCTQDSECSDGRFCIQGECSTK